MRDATRVLTHFRAGVPSIYDSQCANAGSTGICVSALSECVGRGC